MEHSTTVIREFLVGSAGGAAYGFTAGALSHPFDTIKTKQQAHARYVSSNVLQTATGIFRTDGIAGFYQGFAPSLFGSIVFRAIPFAAYSATNQLLVDRDWLTDKPIQRAFISGASGGFLRSFAECPVEVMKTRRQVTNPWTLRSLMTGISITTARNTAVIGTFWAVLVASQPLRDAVSSHPAVNSFLAGGGCSVVAWALVFPLDVLKSRVQSGEAYRLDGTGSTAGVRYTKESLSVFKCASEIMREQGFKGFYAGFYAGIARTIVANGVAMVIYDYVRKSLS
jgi:solute carrier family 25 carnitine/acylcarnitine transporter 20/29